MNEETNPMTVRFTPEEHAYLQLLAAWWCSNAKIPKPDKVAALRKMLRMVKPPTEQTPLGHELRQAHDTLMRS